MPIGKPIRWLTGSTPKTPPFSASGRAGIGALLRRLQDGESLGLPHARPMRRIGTRVYELRVADPEAGAHWRLFYRIDRDAIVVVDWYDKNTQRAPQRILERAARRLREHDRA